MSTLTVELGDRSYPIHVTAELPAPLVATAVTGIGAKRALIITDSNVGPLYADAIRAALVGAGVEASVVEVPAGEATKSMARVSVVLDEALSRGISRRDCVVALGGGVVGDLAGFVAAILHRGVPFVQVPTSLLAQVDSSVGGKTGVNHPTGKNLVGAFWQPRAVISSQATLVTLPDRELRCGLAEALKHGLLADAGLLTWALAHREALLAANAVATGALVEACCRIKAEVVASDEREAGRRALLNLGHTFGHAFELLQGYGALTHGEAVALGTVLAARLSERLGVAEAGLEARTIALLEAFGLPANPDPDPDPNGPRSRPTLDELVAAARSDKKSDGSEVDFVLLVKPGTPLIRRMRWGHIREILRQGD